MKLYVLCLVFTYATVLEAAPTITVSPDNIIMGKTKQINLECAINAEKNSAMKTPLSIKVSLQQPSKNNTKEKVIARFSKIEGLHTLEDKKTVATARLDESNITFINITIDEPTLENTGLYKCEVGGVDKHEKHVTLKASKEVKITSPTLVIVLKEFNKQKEQIDELSDIVQNDNKEIKETLRDIAERLNKIS